MQKRSFSLALFAFVFGLSAAHAAAPVKKFASGGPIEINADSLEVQQQDNTAVFIGHVVAIQGDVRLKSEKMTVHYKAQDETAKPKGDSGGKESIEKIIVEGNVFLSTPLETASGATGIYDVAGDKIFLNDNVVLTRGKNVLKGDKLVYDFAVGKSVITGGVIAKDTGKPGRVRALLIPDEKDKKEEAPKASKP